MPPGRSTVLAVRKLLAYESSQTLEYKTFTHASMSAITVVNFANLPIYKILIFLYNTDIVVAVVVVVVFFLLLLLFLPLLLFFFFFFLLPVVAASYEEFLENTSKLNMLGELPSAQGAREKDRGTRSPRLSSGVTMPAIFSR